MVSGKSLLPPLVHRSARNNGIPGIPYCKTIRVRPIMLKVWRVVAEDDCHTAFRGGSCRPREATCIFPDVRSRGRHDGRRRGLNVDGTISSFRIRHISPCRCEILPGFLSLSLYLRVRTKSRNARETRKTEERRTVVRLDPIGGTRWSRTSGSRTVAEDDGTYSSLYCCAPVPPCDTVSAYIILLYIAARGRDRSDENERR